MSRFIPEGQSNLKSLQAKEKEDYKKFKDEQDEKEHLSLYEQMRLNYLAKEQEYEDKIKARNQSAQLSERELEFYKKLETDKESKEKAKKREIELGVQKYEELKKRKKSIELKENLKEPTKVDLPKRIQIKGIKKLQNTSEKANPSHQNERKQVKAELSEKQKDTDSSEKSTKPSLVSGYDSDSAESD